PAPARPAIQRSIEQDPARTRPGEIDLPLRPDRGDRSLDRVVAVLAVPGHVVDAHRRGPGDAEVDRVREQDAAAVLALGASVAVELGPGQIEPVAIGRAGAVHREPGLVLIPRRVEADPGPVVPGHAPGARALDHDPVEPVAGARDRE